MINVQELLELIEDKKIDELWTAYKDSEIPNKLVRVVLEFFYKEAIALDSLCQSAIPPGPYCYFGSRAPGDKSYRRCPFWQKEIEPNGDEYGVCLYLAERDCALLWDQCKICGINDDPEEDGYDED